MVTIVIYVDVTAAESLPGGFVAVVHRAVCAITVLTANLNHWVLQK